METQNTANGQRHSKFKKREKARSKLGVTQSTNKPLTTKTLKERAVAEATYV